MPDDKLGWIGVTVLSNTQKDSKYVLELAAESDPAQTFTVETDNLNEDNAKLPPLRNPPILEAAEDLTSLSYLNEPAVLHAIKVRYAQLNIYTYSGIVLIATNPFQRVDHYYSQDIIQAYAGKRRGELDPHLFAIAEDAYRCMTTDKMNQTIVVSGESGAGKTVSAKYIMRYFASVEKADHDTPAPVGSEHKTDMSDVEKQILATNPITEAFGNAKTTRNDNSSRFGKYLEILFDNKLAIIGANVRTYLLERSRLVFQPKSERNYHIFYQMLAGMPDDQKAALSLSAAEDFKYLNQGGAITIPGVDDAQDFRLTNESLALIGLDENRQAEIYKILAALLHIGNIEIVATRNDALLLADEPNLVKACALLGIDASAFAKWCVKKQITTRSEKIITNLNHKQALVARDSFSKYIYSALFDWLVDYINADLCPPQVKERIESFIGVLDIYGFEHFERNSFEQFCINYANEKLQQEFNQHVFKLEQEEYVKEEIEWLFIDFADNQPCINLIENRMGVLALLDEESRLPAGNDALWIEKMYQNLDKPPTNKVFKKPRFGQTKFVISHYALDVTYDMDGFIEKNRDTVGEGHLDVLKAADNEMLQSILAVIDKNNSQVEDAGAKKSIALKKPTLGSLFKNSLIDLMATINSTNAHYIRCIKPNEQKEAWKFDSMMVLSQLRACGVLETIRISCAGFPTRWTYEEFADRYHILVPSDDWILVMCGGTHDDVMKLCKQILLTAVESPEKYQLGNTKIFFKAGMLAHFENLRSLRLHAAAVMIQKNLRKVFYRKRYVAIRESLIKLQALFRGHIGRSAIQRAKELALAIRLQTAARALSVRRQVTQAQASIVFIQRALRGRMARKQMAEIRMQRSAIVLQRHARGMAVRRAFVEKKRAAVVLQSYMRRKLAVKQLKQLKEDAKSVNHLTEVSYKLENKVIELTQALTSKIQENKKLSSEIASLTDLLAQSLAATAALTAREAETRAQVDQSQADHHLAIAALDAELAAIKAEHRTAELKVEQLTQEQAELKQQVQQNIAELTAAQEALVKRDTIEVDLKAHIEQLKSELAALHQQQKVALDTRTRMISNKRHSSAGGASFGAGAAVGAAGALGAAASSGFEHQRPVSVIAVANDEYADIDDINDELFRLLRDARVLHREIIEGLLKGLKIPPLGVAADLTRKEVLFPARIIIIILLDMWRLGLTKESEEFLGEVLAVIQQIVSTLKDDEVVPNGAFWLSNTHELYSFVSYAQQTILANDAMAHDMSDEEFGEYLKLVDVVKEDFELLSYNIYNMWMKKMEKDLEKKAISAVVISQSLPGFMAPDSSPFLAKVFSQGTQYKMDDILLFFNSVYWSLKSYFIEEEVLKAVIVELLRFVDALCFNDLIMRRNFLSWKRGLQLNYNVTRLEEWCKGHDIPEGSVYLCHLLQAAKLLQLRKNTMEDIEIIYEICYSLKPTQTQKLISQYYVAEYETPISPEVLQAVADKVKSTDSSHDDLFEVITTDGHFKDPFRSVGIRPFSRVEAYVPAWLSLPVIRRIVELVAKNASAQELEGRLGENGHANGV